MALNDWTVIISGEPRRDAGDIIVPLVFVNNTAGVKIEREVRGMNSMEDLKSYCRQYTSGDDSRKDFFSAVQSGKGGTVDLTTPVDKGATARDQFTIDLRLLQGMERAVTLGVLASDDKAVTDLRSAMAKSLADNPEWINAF